MKLLLNITCINSDTLTGIERFTYHIVSEVLKIDPSALVVSSIQVAEIQSTIKSRLLAFSNSLLNKYEYIVRAVWDQTVFRYLVLKHKPDLVFFPVQDGMLYPPVKQIVTVHDLHYFHFDTGIPECRHEIEPFRIKLYKYKMPHILKHSAAVITVSENTKRDIVDSFGINPEKVHVIYNGYDDGRFRKLEYNQSILDHYKLKAGNYFLFVGSILKHKNLVRLLQAFAGLENDTTLVIAGACKDAEYFAELLQLAADLGIVGTRFSYLEYISDADLPYLYSGAISLMLPSLHEGFGVPIIEAMACGIPVITSNCSAMPEVAGNAALLVDPYSIESIAAAMREVMDNKKQSERMVLAGLERAKHFRWSYSAQKLHKVFMEVYGL